LLLLLTVSSIFQSFPMLGGRRAQVWRYQPAFRRPRHFHEEPEFNLITGGQGTLLLGDRKIEVSAGSLVWFPPGLDHYLASASADFELLTVGFRPALIDAYAREHGESPIFARPWQQLDGAAYRELAVILDEVLSFADHQSAEQRSLQVLRALMRLSLTTADPLGHRAASHVLSDPTTSRDRLARALRSNRGDVSRQLHRDQGTTLQRYRNTLRVLEFLRLCDRGVTNLTRAAIAAGFGSYSQCHRVFRSLLELSPREYLKTRDRIQALDLFEPFEIDSHIMRRSPLAERVT
jgi:AraC-like DNA-binding protein